VPGGIIRETTFAAEAAKPTAKVALEGLGKTGILGGVALGATDFIFHPELTPGAARGQDRYRHRRGCYRRGGGASCTYVDGYSRNNGRGYRSQHGRGRGP